MPRLSIENNIQNLDKIAEFVDLFAEENSLTPKVSFELNLVLDELITNTIHYGYSDDKKHMIDIVIEKEDELLKLEIVDDAAEFNPLEHERNDSDIPLQEKAIGGLGIFFVKQKVDEIDYERKEEKNILYIKKKINVNGD